ELIKDGNETELLRTVTNTASKASFGTLKRITGSKKLCLLLTKSIIRVLAGYPLWYRYIVHLTQIQYPKYFRPEGTLGDNAKHIVNDLETYQEWLAKQNQPKPDSKLLGIDDDSPTLATQPTSPEGKTEGAAYYPGRRSANLLDEQ